MGDEEHKNEQKDSFSIGTNAQGGAFKCYFDDITDPKSIEKINKVLALQESAKNYKQIKTEVYQR